MTAHTLVQVTPDNLQEYGIYCNKNPKSAGYQKKKAWFLKYYPKGLRLVIAEDEEGRPLGFIEYIPGKYAWRPVHAPHDLFIQCLFVYPNQNRNMGIGRELVGLVIDDARRTGAKGVSTFASKGPWIANRELFAEMGFRKADARGRFELMRYPLQKDASDPPFIRDWTAHLPEYQGWHLFYADQCPWHDKAALTLQKVALDRGIDLQVHYLATPEEAQQAPSGFGAFALVRDGVLVEDHYISERRFLNILNKLAEKEV